MSVKCGWASLDENRNTHGGVAGDQTGKEVKTGYWYNFGQNVILRPVKKGTKQYDEALGKEIAKVTEAICDNPKVGYDQWNRTSLWTELEKADWDPAKIQNACETDCSAMVACVLKCCGITINKNVWTGSMQKALLDTGRFMAYTGRQYTESDHYICTGDIILNEKTHVIVSLGNGAKVNKKGSPAKYTNRDSVYFVIGANWPNTLQKGKPFELTGRITDSNVINRVVIGIADEKGKYWTTQVVKKNLQGHVFDIAIDANTEIKFGALAPGKYTYRAWAVDKNGKTLVINKLFSVKE